MCNTRKTCLRIWEPSAGNSSWDIFHNFRKAGLPSAQCEDQSDFIQQPSCPSLGLQNKLPTSKSLELEGEEKCWVACGAAREGVTWFTVSVGKVLREFNKFPRNETACSLSIQKPLSLLIRLIPRSLPPYSYSCWIMSSYFRQNIKHFSLQPSFAF